jgi:hypothetical protein
MPHIEDSPLIEEERAENWEVLEQESKCERERERERRFSELNWKRSGNK